MKITYLFKKQLKTANFVAFSFRGGITSVTLDNADCVPLDCVTHID